MNQAHLRFYEELNDFLPEERRKTTFPHAFQGSVSVKTMIEALGVPHTEVDLILVNGRSVGFDHRLEDGDRISVYPVFESMDISSLTRLRPRPLRKPRFVLDAHLGRLAGFLRRLGLDCLFRNDYIAEELVAVSCKEKRILLTRDRHLLKRSLVTRGYCVIAIEPEEQVKEVVNRFQLSELIRGVDHA